MPETDRLRSQKGGSAKRQSGASNAGKISGGSEPRGGPCDVHKVPFHDVDGNDIYILTGAGKRCSCRVNVGDFVITVHGWDDSEDVRLCPNHFLQLSVTSEAMC